MKHAGLNAADGAAVPLRGVDISGELLGAHARVTVRQRYRNDGPRAIEAVYTFPLPAQAVLVGFAMTVAGRRVVGVVQEREAAFRTYDDAVVAGHGAALLERQRDDVFTATVGNLLPGEDVEVELDYLQRLRADEGALRWTLPTVVAPRYIPGATTGDRTGHGTAAPTDRVPDADLITPPMGAVDYRLAIDLAIDLGRPVVVDSPSHALAVTHDGHRARVRLAAGSAALDRDLVVLVRDGADAPLTGAVAHREGSGDGYFALGVVPDLFDPRRRLAPRDVVFVIDTSGSMGGTSIVEARSALRLCLRHLREGDRFGVVAFASTTRWLQRALAPFDDATLERADRWVAALDAGGGTELRDALVDAVRMVPDGIVVLLTDGQVGNEVEIATAVAAARRTTRVYALGIGTNPGEGLLRELARTTRGEVEFIHPGERVDDKVVAVFARAAAARVTDVKVLFEGVAVAELAPGDAPDLVDGEPWSVFGRYTAPGRGFALVTGDRGGEPFALEVAIELPAEARRPALAKLWAAERVRALDALVVSDPRRAAMMKERAVAIALEHGIASRHTSFVLVEQRSGDRVAGPNPETRVVPVHAPAGWAPPPPKSGIARWDPVTRSVIYDSARGPVPGAPRATSHRFVELMRPSGAPTAARQRSPFNAKGDRFAPAARPAMTAPAPVAAWKALLEAQLAGGLWGRADADAPARMRATAEALATLVRAGVTAAHPLYGPQMRKAIEALLALVAAGVGSPALVAWALAACALAGGDGHRTRAALAAAAAGRGDLPGYTEAAGDAAALRRALDALGRAATTP